MMTCIAFTRPTAPPRWLSRWNALANRMTRDPEHFDPDRMARVMRKVGAARQRRNAYLRARADYEEAFCRMWEDGMTQREIAVATGRNPTAVREILARHFVQIPGGIEQIRDWNGRFAHNEPTWWRLTRKRRRR